MKDTNLYELLHCFCLLIVLLFGQLIYSVFQSDGFIAVLVVAFFGLVMAVWVGNEDLKAYINSIDSKNRSILVKVALTLFRLVYIFGFCLVGFVCLNNANYVISAISFYMTYSYAKDLIKG